MDLNLKINKQPKLLKLCYYPDPILSVKSKPVISDVTTDYELQELMDDMCYTMEYNHGIGLAAIQVGVPLQILIVQDQKQEPIKIINPVIKDTDGEEVFKEGCLSAPGIYLNIKRPKEAMVEYLTEHGERKTTVMSELLGRAILHEYDHLLGITFFDKVSKLERSLALEKYRKLRKKLGLNAA